MIGSPDLLAFSGAEGFSEGPEEKQEAQSIPEELSIPLFPSENPWSSSAQFNRDFILVAEFSEQVGPTPVLTIPDDRRVVGSFDLNHFSVRIMSVDYQASGPSPVLPFSSGPRLTFSEDSKVVLGDSAEDAFAYVHHVTLYDLEARGMVRPFCMAYVCSDQSKLMENFTELSTCFSQASDSLKTGNRQAFSMELQRKLHYLEYKRLSLKQETKLSPAANRVTEESAELEAIEQSILNHRELLRQVTSYPNRKLKQPNFLPYHLADSLTDSSFLPSEPLPTQAASLPRSEQQLKPLHELCNAYFLSLMKEQLADTERHLRGDRSVLQTSSALNSLSKGLTLTNFLFELWAPDDGEDEEEEKTNAGRSKAEPLSIESFFSCVEEISIKMEPERRHKATSDPAVSMEMTGSVSSNDSIEVLGTEKSFRTQHDMSGTDSRADNGLTIDTLMRRVPVEAGGKRVYARRANSEDSIEVLSTTESIFPEDLTAITEEAEQQMPLSNGFHSDKDTVTEAWRREQPPVNCELKQQTAESKHTAAAEGIKESLKNTHVQDKPWTADTHLQAEDVLDSTPGWSTGPLSLVQNLHVNTLSAVTRWSQSSTPGRMLSVDETSECTSATSSSDHPSPTQKVTGTQSDRRRRKAGLRALRFLKQNSFSQHAVFCLLSGRPLVVVGGDEGLVRKTVDGLSLFLPAPDGGAVMPSLTTALQLTDLLTWRLIGIHRSTSNCSAGVDHSLTHYSRYLAVLDLEQRTLCAPSYSGFLIGQLAEPQCGFRRGLTYLLHLESGLTVLQNQALLYTFCPEFQQRFLATHETGQHSPPASDCDVRVLRFLSDLMAQRHAGRGPPVLRFTYSSVQLHKNTAAA